MNNIIKTFLFVLVLFCTFSMKSLAQAQFSGERLQSAVRSYVEKTFKNCEVEVEFNSGISDYTFKEKGITARITGDAASIMAFKKVGLEFLKDGIIEKKTDISLRLKIFKTFACAARELPSGAVVKATDIILLKKEASTIDEDELPERQDIIGKTILKPIFKTGIFTHSSLHSGGVRRNTVVDVFVRSGAVSIRTSGKVLNDAVAGESVRISREKGVGIVTGKATKNGSVIILTQ